MQADCIRSIVLWWSTKEHRQCQSVALHMRVVQKVKSSYRSQAKGNREGGFQTSKEGQFSIMPERMPKLVLSPSEDALIVALSH